MKSNLLLYRSQGIELHYDLISAERRDLLLREGEEWKIRQRLILLDHSVLTMHNLSVFL